MIFVRTTHAQNNRMGLFEKSAFIRHKFRRQVPIEKYIVDFYCHELKLLTPDGKIWSWSAFKR